MGLYAGDLRHRIKLMRRTTVPQGTGREESWSAFATIWAQVVGINGREAVIGQALQGVSYYKIVTRFRTDLTPDNQIRYGALDLNIRSVSDPDGLREQLLILADTGSAEMTNGG